jgi:hypothetical protein
MMAGGGGQPQGAHGRAKGGGSGRIFLFIYINFGIKTKNLMHQLGEVGVATLDENCRLEHTWRRLE